MLTSLTSPRHDKQSGINMVDLMMWLVIAALLLAAAIAGISYYQQAAYVYQAKSDLSGGHTWAASHTSLTSKAPTVDDLQEALDASDYKITNDNDLVLIASSGQKYCIGIKAGNVKVSNVFYSTSDDPSRILRGTEMPASCGTPGEAGGPNAPAADSDSDGTPNTADNDIDNDGVPNIIDPDMDGDGTPNTSDSDIDGDRVVNIKDDTPNGFSSDTDTDKDGILDSADPDIDNDGVLNIADNDIDGDGSLNPGDLSAYGGGSYSGPSPDSVIEPAPAGTLTDPNVVISSVDYDPNGMDINFNLNIKSSAGGWVGIIYHFQYRISCAHPDGSQFYKHGMVETSYKNGSPTTRTFKASCPQDAGITTAIGYVGGAMNAHHGLITGTGYRGPINVATGGVVHPLRGHDPSTDAVSSTSRDSRVFIRNVKISGLESIKIGLALEVGGASSVGVIYGVQWRITCQLPDGSQYYKTGTLTTSYKRDTYPAPDYTAACQSGSIARGYVVGPDGGDPALTSSIGYRGPINVTRGGIVSPLEGNSPSTAMTDMTYVNQRVSVRNVTFSGNNANIGININLGGVGSIGAPYGFSYRLTCKATADGAISYKTGYTTTSYGNGSSNPAATFPTPCLAGTEAVGAVVGPYAGHPALTAGGSYKGPNNYAVVGQQ